MNQELIYKISNAIKKTNAHINSGFFINDKRNLESIFINFFKKEIKARDLEKYSSLYGRIKLDCFEITLDNNYIYWIDFKQPINHGYRSVTYIMKQLDEFVLYITQYLSEIDYNNCKINFDIECTTKQLGNLIEKIENFSFTN